ncbi:hypothetical protein Tco_1425485 [Tanacetum coccineum]
MQSSSVSSDFASQFLILDNFPPTDNEVVYMMNVKVRHKEPSTQTPSLLTILVTVISETSTAAAPTIPRQFHQSLLFYNSQHQLLHQQLKQLQPEFLHF